MATLTVRNLPEETRRALKSRAAAHNRSMEAEVRDILVDAVAPTAFITDWLSSTVAVRGEFDVPERSAPRSFDLA
jgi:plasmid stability protein